MQPIDCVHAPSSLFLVPTRLSAAFRTLAAAHIVVAVVALYAAVVELPVVVVAVCAAAHFHIFDVAVVVVDFQISVDAYSAFDSCVVVHSTQFLSVDSVP